MLLLHTSDPSGTVFVRTDQLDGETDWKVRESIKYTQQRGSLGVENIINESWSVLAEPPSDFIYQFKGLFLKNAEFNQGLKISNTLLANMKIASGEVIGLVIYVGKETRIELNNKKTESKFGKTDIEINTMTKYLFFILTLLSLFLLILSGKLLRVGGIIFFVRVFIIMSSIIPISMKVNVDFAKLYYSLVINKDKNMEGTVVRNSTIPEELGRIQYLLCDKTGTLTQNKMKFSKFRSFVQNFDMEDFKLMKTWIHQFW